MGDFSSTDYTETLVLNGQRMTGLLDWGKNYSVICVNLCHLIVSLWQNVIQSVSSVLSQRIWVNSKRSHRLQYNSIKTSTQVGAKSLNPLKRVERLSV